MVDKITHTGISYTNYKGRSLSQSNDITQNFLIIMTIKNNNNNKTILLSIET